MYSFRQYLRECLDGEASLPATEGTNESVNFHDPVQREATNFILSDITDESGSPIVVYERVRQVLMDMGYSIPPVSARPELFEGTDGEEVFGMTRPMPPDSPEPAWCYLYFAFAQDEAGLTYDILAEIVTSEELEEILYEDVD